jgi:hypothetical protein
MSTFENGWICKSCWKPNREQDMRCYRCKAPNPDYDLVMQVHERAPRPPRKPVLGPALSHSRAAVGRAWTGAWSAAFGGVRNVFAAIRFVASLPVTAVRAAARAVSSAALATFRVAVTVVQVIGSTVAAAARAVTRAVAFVGSAVASAARAVARAVVFTAMLPVRLVAAVLRWISAMARSVGRGFSQLALALSRTLSSVRGRLVGLLQVLHLSGHNGRNTSHLR